MGPETDDKSGSRALPGCQAVVAGCHPRQRVSQAASVPHLELGIQAQEDVHHGVELAHQAHVLAVATVHGEAAAVDVPGEAGVWRPSGLLCATCGLMYVVRRHCQPRPWVQRMGVPHAAARAACATCERPCRLAGC